MVDPIASVEDAAVLHAFHGCLGPALGDGFADEVDDRMDSVEIEGGGRKPLRNAFDRAGARAAYPPDLVALIGKDSRKPAADEARNAKDDDGAWVLIHRARI